MPEEKASTEGSVPDDADPGEFPSEVSEDGVYEEPGPLRFVVYCEQVFFSLLLFGLIAAGLTPIVCRQLDWPGPQWTGPLSKQLVLWVALFGASAATRDRKHIRIDAIGLLLPERARKFLRSATQLFGAVICGWLAYPGWQSVWGEEPLFSGDMVVLWGLSERTLAMVIPIGLALLAVRFLLASFFDFLGALKKERGGVE